MPIEIQSVASEPVSRPGTPHTPLPFLGLACAVGVSTIYLNQPLLLEMTHSFGTTVGRTGFVAVATQVGYACGLLCFVPLGDVLERRALIVRMFAAVAIALLLVGFAPNFGVLVLGSALAGLLASVTHIVLPIAPDLVDSARRGRAIGIVMTGLLLGILLARTFAGWVGTLGGWRAVFLTAAIINAAFAPLIWRFMPKLPPRQEIRYKDAMRSLWTLVRTQPLLRESCVMGAMIFGSFSCLWTTLAFLLNSHYGLGPGVTGSFGVVGAAGALVAPLSGRLSDRHGPRWVLSVGLVALGISWAILWGEEFAAMPTALHMAALVVGIIALDGGTQMMQVANQTRIFGLDPSARSRLNTVYMTFYFTGAAAGSALATIAWVHGRWNGVSALALGFVGLAALRHVTGRKDGAPGGRIVAANRDSNRIEDCCLEA